MSAPNTPREYEGFKVVATRAVTTRGQRVVPIMVGDKNPCVKWLDTPVGSDDNKVWAQNWQQWIDYCDSKFPDANVATIAKDQEYCFIDEDTSDEFRKGYEAFAGEPFPRTWTTQSRPNHRQSHWLQTNATRKLGNVAQTKVGDIEFSFRQHNLYVLSEGSRHPSGSFYDPFDGSPAIPMPEKMVAYIQHLRTQANGTNGNKATVGTTDDEAPIPQGQRNTTLASLAGRYYRAGLDEDDVYNRLVKDNQRCTPPLSDTDLRTISHSIAGTGRQRKTPLEESFDAGFEQRQRAAEAKQAQEQAEQMPQVPANLDTSGLIPYPVFPREVMEGTSLYEGFAKPISEGSDKYPELLFMPAVLMMVNCIFGKVHLKPGNGDIRPNLFLGVVAPYGDYFKSTCCELAQQYFIAMGRAMEFDPRTTKNVEGKIAISNAGSSEGFGKQMIQANATHAVLYYDELSKFVGKAHIEHSSLISDLLKWSESRAFGNLIKAQKDSFHFGMGTYCFSWMWATTDRKFPGLWAELPGDHADFDNRVFFLMAPEQPKERRGRWQNIDTSAGVIETQRRIDKAVGQKVYDYDDPNNVFGTKIDNVLMQFSDARDQNILQILALYFAIDLGRDSIDDDCVERSAKLIRYRQQTLAYLEPTQADTKEAVIVQQVIRYLKKNGGKVPTRKLEHDLHLDCKGHYWRMAQECLRDLGRVIFAPPGRGGRQQYPGMAYLVIPE
jgi:primase-like protein/bifunctional DNA primase/polymerase-like protein